MRVTPAPLAVAAVVLSTVLALVGAAPAAAKGVPVHVDLAGDDLKEAAPGLLTQLWEALKSPKCRVANLR